MSKSIHPNFKKNFKKGGVIYNIVAFCPEEDQALELLRLQYLLQKGASLDITCIPLVAQIKVKAVKELLKLPPGLFDQRL